MGLAERRAIKEFEDKITPNYQQKLLDITGKNIELEVDWNSLAIQGKSNLYKDWESVFFEPLVKAFKNVCVDDMGKGAVQESVNKIVIGNQNDNFSATKWSTFNNGTVTLDHNLVNVNDVLDRANYLQQTLENGL